MIIRFARGDSYDQGFQIKRANENQMIDGFDEIYFTVKRKYSDKNYLFQKTLSGGGIDNDGDGHYTIRFYPSDTSNLFFGEYDFDIELVLGEDNYKKTFTGKLYLDPEVTHADNE